jgi:hypothetical protein
MEDNKIIYDAKKNYRWTPEDQFSFSGTEYGFMFNTLMSKKRELMAQLEMLTLMESKLKQAVEAGIAVEDVPQEDPIVTQD